MLHYTKKFLLKNSFSKFLANFVFAVSHLKIHAAVHLNTSKALTLWKVFQFINFRYSYVLTCLKEI